ncbi:MAG: hypothetical protein PUJ35_10435, partial [Ruminococcus bromii]|nr:hypothetical protein [Ruminococcus bromii]
MTNISDIRERNDRPKDKQPKHRTASAVQRQMVQKFVKELNDSAKQSDRSGSAETTATEQVETTAREIVHEAVQLPHRAIQYPARKESADSSANAQPEQSTQPHHAPESPRERTDAPRTRSDATSPQSTSIPAPQELARRAYVQQTAKTATPAQPITSEQPQHTTVTVPSAENAPRQRPVDIRTLSEPKRPQRAPATTPQEQTRRAYVQQTAKKVTTAPSITPEQSQPQAPTVTAPLMENTPRQRTDDVRTRPEAKQPRSAPTLTPQEQGRRAYVRQAKKSRAEKPSARDHLHTEQPEIRSPVQSEAVPAKPSTVRHVKQPGAWTPRSSAAPVMRGKEQSIRERPAVTQSHDLPPVPQAQARQAFIEKQAQLSQNPSIESIYPSESAAPVPPQLPVSEASAITPKRQPVTAGSGKSASPTPQPVQPLAEHPPTIREKPKPTAAPREKSRRGVDIRTRDTEQITPPTAQPKTSVSKIDTKRARKTATQDAQRKMLKKSNNRAARAAAAAAKKLAEAAAKAVKELISALASLGGGTALFVVFSIVIVAGAFLASPLGILFADE